MQAAEEVMVAYPTGQLLLPSLPFVYTTVVVVLVMVVVVMVVVTVVNVVPASVVAAAVVGSAEAMSLVKARVHHAQDTACGCQLTKARSEQKGRCVRVQVRFWAQGLGAAGGGGGGGHRGVCACLYVRVCVCVCVQ